MPLISAGAYLPAGLFILNGAALACAKAIEATGPVGSATDVGERQQAAGEDGALRCADANPERGRQ